MKKHFLFMFFISLILSIFVFFVGNYYLGVFNNAKIASVVLGEEYSILAGIVRNEGNGWKLIQDDSHETIGILDVSQDEKKIIINYDGFRKVNSLTATVDETMASEGYTVGASVGVSETWISIYDREGNLINPTEYVNNSGNIWINGVFKK